MRGELWACRINYWATKMQQITRVSAHTADVYNRLDER